MAALTPVLLAGCSGSTQARPTNQPAIEAQTVPSVQEAGQPLPSPAQAAPPVRVRIGAAAVDAAIEPVGTDAAGRMAPPSTPDRVGWFSSGSLPGEAGTAILDGHLDWFTGPAVFWRLGNLRSGDEVLVTRADGTSARFLVSSVTNYPYDVTPAGILGPSGRPALALITCAGAWDRSSQNYQERLVVRAYYAPPPAASPPPEPD